GDAANAAATSAAAASPRTAKGRRLTSDVPMELVRLLGAVPVALELQARLDLHLRAGRHRVGEPDVAADHAAAPDHRLAAQDRGAGVDGDVVLDRGMALHAAQHLAGARGERAERDALVEDHAVADLRRLADHDAGAVIDEEAPADP